jgi:hypothetical protein
VVLVMPGVACAAVMIWSDKADALSLFTNMAFAKVLSRHGPRNPGHPILDLIKEFFIPSHLIPSLDIYFE